jgi:hypothetical protein
MSQNFTSSQKIPQQATEHKKLSKVTSGYVEIDEFKDADTHKGYFCYNCDYFLKPDHCMIVTDEGQDLDGNISGKILSYAVCSLWTPNEKEIK